jgi:hypothetical protein
VVQEGDGIKEVVMYPESNDSPGNFGTLNIGGSANSTAHLSEQILHGLSPEDLDYHGGELGLGDAGVLYLGGDTGISSGIEDELHAIRGQKRSLPIYREVGGEGNNAQYQIVKFVGIRVMEVQLNGKNKRLIVQPSTLAIDGAIPSEISGTSEFVVSPSRLVK